MSGSGGGELFSLAWGVFATGFGWTVATNFRGAADRFLRLSQRSVPFGRGRPAPLGVGFFRVLAGVFAVAGPVMVIVGLLGVLEGPWNPGRFPELPLAMDLAMVVVTAASLWTFWRRSGMLRREWTAGGGLQRAACTVATAAVLGFPATMASRTPSAPETYHPRPGLKPSRAARTQERSSGAASAGCRRLEACSGAGESSEAYETGPFPFSQVVRRLHAASMFC